jgi:hypothetical protein
MIGIEKFDWVTARASCSIGSVFEHLRDETKADVAVISKLLELNGYKANFTFESEQESFMVSRATNGKSDFASVKFSRKEKAITVSKSGTVFLAATLTINNERQCRLVVNGQELEEWQFRKLALEQIFFGETE